jgi:hypothetical protein
MVINICYWIGVALPPADHWNLTRLTVLEIRVEDERPPPGSASRDHTPSCTEALWKPIAIAGTKTSVKEAGWAPKTPAWDDWLHEAEAVAKVDSILTTTT